MSYSTSYTPKRVSRLLRLWIGNGEPKAHSLGVRPSAADRIVFCECGFGTLYWEVFETHMREHSCGYWESC